MQSNGFKSKSNFPVNVAVSDQIKSWPKFVSEAFDTSTKTISCHVHHVGIGHTRNIAKRYMVGANVAALQEEFWARSVATPYSELKLVVQKKIYQWLKAVKQPKAAQWFQQYHTGEGNGNWMWADAGVASITTIWDWKAQSVSTRQLRCLVTQNRTVDTSWRPLSNSFPTRAKKLMTSF